MTGTPSAARRSRGLALIAAALALLSRVPVHSSYVPHLLPALLIFGAGGGLTLPALAGLGMSGASPSDAGLASGLFNTTQQVGAALGLAVLSTLATARAAGLHAAGLGTPAALTGGYRLAFGVGAGLALAAIVLAAAVLRPKAASRPPATAGSHATRPVMRHACLGR